MAEEINPIEIVPNYTKIDHSTFEAIKDKLPNTLFVKNRARFISLFKEQVKSENSLKFGLFKGSEEVPLHATDFTYPSYQEAYFYYLFGVTEMGCYGVMDFQEEKPILFVPRMDNLNKIWMTVMNIDDFKAKYELQDVFYLDELPVYLQ